MAISNDIYKSTYHALHLTKMWKSFVTKNLHYFAIHTTII